MADIVLTHSYMLDFDPKQKRIGQPWAPLGTLYAASVLKSSGYSVYFHDAMFFHRPDAIIPVLEKEKPRLLVIYDDSFCYLSKMCLDNMRKVALEMAKLGKEHGARVIISSSDASDNYSHYLAHHADFVILGEAEFTLRELVGKLLDEGADSFDQIKGCAYVKDSEVKVNSPRELISDPDVLPFPAWELLDVEQYRKTWKSRNPHFTLNMVTTRGCPFQCIWCAKPIYGNHYSSRSPLNVVKEMVFIQNELKPDKIWFADDIFGLKPGWIEEFEKQARIHNIKMTFSIQSRVDLLLGHEQVQALANAGCRKIWLGIESGSQKILDAMQKGITLEQIRSVSPIIRKAGIEQAFFIQLGFPGETKEDIQKTIHLLVDLMPDDIGISVTYPLPGTKFFDSVKKQLENKSHWADSDDLSMLYKGTFASDYYKLLHRYIHKYFRFRQSVYYLEGISGFSQKLTYNKIRRILLMPYYLLFSLGYKLMLNLKENGGKNSI